MKPFQLDEQSALVVPSDTRLLTRNIEPPQLRADGDDGAVAYLVEELGADVNAVDHEGNTAMHNAAARGDVEMTLYLVAKAWTRRPSTARGRRRRTWGMA